MLLKNVLFIVFLIVMALAGIYLVFSSGYVNADLFNVILFVIVGALIIYFYVVRLRERE